MHFITNGYRCFSKTTSTDPRQRVPLIVKNFAQECKCHDWDLNPHSAAANTNMSVSLELWDPCWVLIYWPGFLSPPPPTAPSFEAFSYQPISDTGTESPTDRTPWDTGFWFHKIKLNSFIISINRSLRQSWHGGHLALPKLNLWPRVNLQIRHVASSKLRMPEVSASAHLTGAHKYLQTDEITPCSGVLRPMPGERPNVLLRCRQATILKAGRVCLCENNKRGGANMICFFYLSSQTIWNNTIMYP